MAGYQSYNLGLQKRPLRESDLVRAESPLARDRYLKGQAIKTAEKQFNAQQGLEEDAIEQQKKQAEMGNRVSLATLGLATGNPVLAAAGYFAPEIINFAEQGFKHSVGLAKEIGKGVEKVGKGAADLASKVFGW